MKKIAIFTGTRAEYGLLKELMVAIKNSTDLTLQIMASGTHFSPEFGYTYQNIIDDGFAITESIEMLMSSNTPIGTVKSMGVALIGFADALQRMKPDCLIILGDRYEALAAAQASFFLRIPIIHIHGGEITEGAYDDAIRHAITKLSLFHFTSTEEYRNRVIQLGESPNRVFNVGAIGLDYINNFKNKFLSKLELSKSLNFEINKPFFLITYHPVTLAHEEPAETFHNLISALDTFPEHQIIITYPNADDGGRIIIKLIESYANSNSQRILATPSLGQIRYLSAAKLADAVIGNSSSGIIEIPSLNTPTINIGSRQRGRLAARSILNCGTTTKDMSAAIKNAIEIKYLQDESYYSNPYGQGDTTSKILAKIRSIDNWDLVKKFHNLS